MVGPSGSVARIAALGDQAFEPQLAHLLEQADALLLDVFGVANRTATRDQLVEGFLAHVQRQEAQIPALELQQVEGEVGRRMLHRCHLHVGGAAQSGALGQAAEVGLAVVGENNHLAVENQRLVGQRAKRRNQLRVQVRGIATIAVAQEHLARVESGHQPIAVVLELEQPTLARERGVGRLGKHQVEARGR